MSKAVETKTSTHESAAPASCDTKTETTVPLMDHLTKGAGDMMFHHLHGLTLGLTHFLGAREEAHAAGHGDKFEVMKHLNEAHRKYKLHTHDATNVFVDHMLARKSASK